MPAPLRGFEHVNRYWDRTHGTYAAKILPGEYYVTRENELVVTVLGSCVSACVRDCVVGVGGMNHFMLPGGAGQSDAWGRVGLSAATRYGNVAMEHLINQILKNGGQRKNLEFKVFGGGRILAQMTDIGRRNIDFVLEYVATEGFEIASRDLGDRFPRKIVYDPKTGRVRVKKLQSLQNNTIVERETEYMRELESTPLAGEIDLF